MSTMRINAEIIKKLNPCKDRFDNYLNHYADFDDDLREFILLDNISYSDKVWVFTRLATKLQNVKWSLMCASKVLYIFEEEYPDDDRPRKAIDACENYINNPTEASSAAAVVAAAHASYASYAAAYASYASYAAAYASYASYAAAAAYAAAYAAAFAAYDSAYAADAACASADASADRENEEELNLLLMLDCV